MMKRKLKNRNDNYFFVVLNTHVSILLIGNIVEEKWTMKRKLKNSNDNYFFVVFNTHVTILLISNM